MRRYTKGLRNTSTKRRSIFVPKRLAQKIARQERILSTLADLTYATSKQINNAINLGGDRNARRILYEMENDKLVGSLRRESKVYYLAGKGGDLIGKDNPRLKRSQIDHAVMRNELRARLGYPKDWCNEVPIKINGEVIVIADAVYSEGGRLYFVEIDNQTSMQTNNSKIKRYAKIVRNLKQSATLGWYTMVESRKRKLRENTEKAGIHCHIY